MRENLSSLCFVKDKKKDIKKKVKDMEKGIRDRYMTQEWKPSSLKVTSSVSNSTRLLNLDILSIHNHIIHHYHKKKQRSPSIPMGIKMETEMKPSVYDTKTREEETCGDPWEGEITIITSEHMSFYIIQAVPLLEKYTEIRKRVRKIPFSQTGKRQDSSNTCDPISISNSNSISNSISISNSNSNEDDFEMKQLIDQYLQLAQSFFPQLYHQLLPTEEESTKNYPVSYHSTSNTGVNSGSTSSKYRSKSASSSKCTGCGKESSFVLQDNFLICEQCGSTTEFVRHSIVSYKDIDRVNMTTKYQYDRITHFKDCINQFQGKQNATIDPKIYEDLIHQFRQHDLIPENWKSLPKEEAFSKITKEHILVFLKETNHTKHYEDVVLIHCFLTGVAPPDISGLENVLLQDFDALTQLYDKKYRNHERKNFINTQYVLFQLLRRHRYPCKKEDFNILKTIDRKYYHDDITRTLFEELGFNFTATF